MFHPTLSPYTNSIILVQRRKKIIVSKKLSIDNWISDFVKKKKILLNRIEVDSQGNKWRKKYIGGGREK